MSAVLDSDADTAAPPFRAIADLVREHAAARPDQRVRVWRFNEVDIAGGLPGSRFRVKVRQTVEPVIVQ